MALVFGLMEFSTSSILNSPVLLHKTFVYSTLLSEFKGLITALCSIEETITWSFSFNNPLISTFMLSVIFLVKITFSGLLKQNNSHKSSLVS